MWKGRYADNYLNELTDKRLYWALQFVKDRMHDLCYDGITHNGKTYKQWYRVLSNEFSYRRHKAYSELRSGKLILDPHDYYFG